MWSSCEWSLTLFLSLQLLQIALDLFQLRLDVDLSRARAGQAGQGYQQQDGEFQGHCGRMRRGGQRDAASYRDELCGLWLRLICLLTL